MNSAAGLPVSSSDVASRAAAPEVSLFRLYTLRLCYLILAGGIGTYFWPSVIHHTNEFAIAEGVRLSLLAGLGATALLGFRYPVQMIPLLAFRTDLEGRVHDLFRAAALVGPPD